MCCVPEVKKIVNIDSSSAPVPTQFAPPRGLHRCMVPLRQIFGTQFGNVTLEGRRVNFCGIVGTMATLEGGAISGEAGVYGWSGP